MLQRVVSRDRQFTVCLAWHRHPSFLGHLILGGAGPAGRVSLLVRYQKAGQKKEVARREGPMKAAFVALVLLVGAGGLALACEQPTRFKITTKRADDAVEVQADKDKTVFDVKSPFGISQAIIERQEDTWPDAVVLRLHLKGLESFRASNGKVMLDAAVSIQEGKVKVRLWKDAKEDAPLDEKSPLWTAIRILGGDGKPAQELPLKDGYFEVALPRAFFEGNPKAITLNWIDFHRG
jgi:hypothetical protein